MKWGQPHHLKHRLRRPEFLALRAGFRWWGQPRTWAMITALLLAVPSSGWADAGEVRQTIGGVLTAGPAATGLVLSLAGAAAPNRDLWVSGMALAGLGPSVGHLINGRYAASLALLGVKSVGLGVMVESAARDEFLDPQRPMDPQFWVGWFMFGLAAGAEVYLGIDDIRDAQGWWVSPWASRDSAGVALGWSFARWPFP
ncbi:MAG: hypothetical protein HYT87_01305 [Nitrospirae bacterium]|nr:hypothetical protein [Nitrospirota bacterium]